MCKPGLWSGFGLIFRSAGQNLCCYKVSTRHTAAYRANLQGAESVTATHAVLSSLPSLPCTNTTVPDMLSLLEAARGSCPVVPACTMVRQLCRCWQADMTDNWPSCQISSCVDAGGGGVVASAVLAGWLKKVQKNLLCGRTGGFLLPVLQPFST